MITSKVIERYSYPTKLEDEHYLEPYLKKLEDEHYAKLKFQKNLLRLLELESIEDGYSHPAENLMEENWCHYRLDFSNWVQTIFIDNICHPQIAAGILQCLGRLKKEIIEPWGYIMAIAGLSRPDLEVRDAAVIALELWGGQQSLDALKGHIGKEQVSWLKNYIEKVIQELSE